MHRGYIKLWRKSLDGGWLSNPNLWTFWSYCLLKASHKKYKTILGFTEIELEPGQFIFGRKQASKDIGLSEQMVRTCLHTLKSTNNITIKSTNKFSIISIINWDIYQSEEEEVNQQNNQQNNQRLTSKQPTTNHIQEQQEHKEDNILSVSGKNGHVPYLEIQTAFNEILGDFLPQISALNEQRKKTIKQRFNTDDKTKTLEWWRDQFFPLIADSDFLTGRNGKWTSCSFDWILKQANFQKIREGTYNR